MAQYKQPTIEPKIHRRILGFLNKARTVKELAADPRLKIQPDLAKAIFEKRATVGAFGFTDVAQLRDIARFPEILGGLIDSFGSAAFGLWDDTPIDLKLPDGTTNFSAPHAALLHNGKVLFIGTSVLHSVTLIFKP